MKIEIEEKDWMKLHDYGDELEGVDIEYWLPSRDLSDLKLEELLQENFPEQWSEETREEIPCNGYFYRIGYLPIDRRPVIFRTKSQGILKLIHMYSRGIFRTSRK